MSHVAHGHSPAEVEVAAAPVTLGSPLVRVATPVQAPTQAPTQAPAPAGLVARLARRLPLEALAITLLGVTALALFRGTTPVLAALVAAVLGVQVLRSVPPAGVRLGAAFGRVARSLLVPVGVLALALHVLTAPRRLIDDVLLLGVLGAVVAGLVAALVSLRSVPPRVVVVGDLPQVRGLVARWIDERSVHVVGGLVVGSPAELAEAGLSDLGIVAVPSVAEVVGHVERYQADLVVAAPGPAVNADAVRELSWALEASPARLAVIGATEHVAPHRIDLDLIAGSTMSVLAPPRASRAAALGKSLVDRVLAGLLLLAVSPLLVTLALLIRLDSPGSAIFTQQRVGRGGRLFRVYKLRTMRADAESLKAELQVLDEGNGVLFKIREDPRVTRLGRLLRRSSLDELPQLLNVVRGEMSLIGPRPALPEEVARYTQLERRRLAVRPGITGLWQVSGRSSLSRERSMRLDSSYVDNWRARGDVAIALRTVHAVVSKRGAY
ncbi:sugar transferase [Nocardioides nanhaiensis]|uniref:Bacterial sugar transferase domain-containing protein n=1 Tax=Nocardioides nanhaiensis TaxID=1476871 RepID=A0ABP8W0G3_9ACTN